jgi:uncharacterized OB-fold protein
MHDQILHEYCHDCGEIYSPDGGDCQCRHCLKCDARVPIREMVWSVSVADWVCEMCADEVDRRPPVIRRDTKADEWEHWT